MGSQHRAASSAADVDTHTSGATESSSNPTAHNAPGPHQTVPNAPGPNAPGPNPAATLPPLELLKTIGDDTRYAILMALGQAALPMTTAALSDAVGLHANTIRPHLDRMRDAGLVVREIAADGGVGRPRHTYRIANSGPLFVDGAPPTAGPDTTPAPDSVPAPDGEARESELPRTSELSRTEVSSGLESLLVKLAVAAGVTDEEARRMGFQHGAARAARAIVAEHPGTPGLIDHASETDPGARESQNNTITVLLSELDRLGFGPRLMPGSPTNDRSNEVRIDFTACPFDDGADDAPDVACSLHEGIVDGLACDPAEPAGVTFVTRSDTSTGRTLCHARVVTAPPRYDLTTNAHRVGAGQPSLQRTEPTKE